MPLIAVEDLKGLASRIDGRDKLGELLRSLIWSWVPHREPLINFLSGTVNTRPGWDGTVYLGKDKSGNEHRSVWEISVQAQTLQKIKKDFRNGFKRSLPSGWTHAETTYVAVTLQYLNDRDGLETQLKKVRGNPWADVRIIHVHDLEQWIEKSPVAEAWASEEFGIGLGRYGQTLGKWWTTWSGATDPSVTERLVLGGRDITDLKNRLASGSSPAFYGLQADSPDEAVAILYAAISELPPERRNSLLANALVVSSKESAEGYALENVREEATPLTVLLPPATAASNILIKKGHWAINAFGRREPQNSAGLYLRRPLRTAFEQALQESMGLSPTQAATEARACGASLSIWRVWNLLYNSSPGSNLPIWASDNTASVVIPAVLLRGWDESYEGDREIVSRICGRPYNEYRDTLHQYKVCDSPLLESVATVYRVVAPVFAFALFAKRITLGDLEKFREALHDVLKHIDDDLTATWSSEGPDTPRPTRPEKYSTWIRNGLTETLLNIAVLGTPLEQSGVLGTYANKQAYVDSAVRSLTALRNDVRLLAALREQLPVLAEAAPAPFVEALESLLQGDSLEIQKLFRDRGFFAPTYHAGLLWALEELAWSPDYLAPVTLLLARLAALDPGGKISNRPLNSLREIYLAWHPGTAASLDDRESALQTLHIAHPEIAWSLAKLLLPRMHETSTGTHEPEWRDFGRSELPPLTNAGLIDAYRTYATIAIQLSKDRLDRLLELLETYPDLAPDHQEQIETALAEHAKEYLNETTREQAWEQIRQLVARHRSFANTTWALSESKLAVLERIGELYRPNDILAVYRFLFDEDFPDLPRQSDDPDEWQHDLDQKRSEALAAVLRLERWDGIAYLIRTVRLPYIVGATIPSVVQEYAKQNPLIQALGSENTPPNLQALRGLSRVNFFRHGNSWTKAFISLWKNKKWHPEILVAALLDYPPTMETYQLVAAFGPSVDALYWKQSWAHFRDISDETINFAVDKLINHGRASEALEASDRHFAALGTDKVLHVIDKAIEELNAGRVPPGRSMFTYHLENAFKWLHAVPEVNRTGVAQREYALLPLITGYHSKEPLFLHKFSSTDASFFVQVLCDLYKKSGKSDEPAPDENRKARANAAWRLLNSWVSPPGYDESGNFSISTLTTWISTARNLAREQDRADIGDEEIGKILRYLPFNSKGALSAELSQILESLKSRHIERGFELEVLNSRGVTSRAPLDGGKQERALAEEWRAKAKAIGNRWPRAKAMCLRIAENWDQHAKWHDDDADKQRLQW